MEVARSGGAEFSIVFRASAGASSRHKEDQVYEHTSILVVEDENIVAKDVATGCSTSAMRLGTLARGEEAIEITRREHPELVLMDIMLKGRMDGIEAAGRLPREYDIAGHLPDCIRR